MTTLDISTNAPPVTSPAMRNPSPTDGYLVVVLSSSVSPADAECTRTWPRLDLSGDGITAAPSMAQRLRSMASLTGLTWEQIAVTLGVTRRSVHLWLAGGRISAINQQRIGLFESLVSQEKRYRETPDALRARLTAPRGGRSVLASWRDKIVPIGDERTDSPLSRLDEAHSLADPLTSSNQVSEGFGVIEL